MIQFKNRSLRNKDVHVQQECWELAYFHTNVSWRARTADRETNYSTFEIKRLKLNFPANVEIFDFHVFI